MSNFVRPNQTDVINNNLSHHTLTDEQTKRCRDIGELAKSLASFIDAKCPDGREKSLAFTNLELTVLWARAAIERGD